MRLPRDLSGEDLAARLTRLGYRITRPRTVTGADAIIAPGCSKLSGRFEDFSARRADRRAAA